MSTMNIRKTLHQLQSRLYVSMYLFYVLELENTIRPLEIS